MSVAASRWARWVGLAQPRAASAAGPPALSPCRAGGTPDRGTVTGWGTAFAEVRGTAPDCDLATATDPGTPLFEVRFAVVDVETTGGSPDTGALTEIAAARYRGGECLGTFQTLVDPGREVPALISLLTGITDDMVAGAPPPSSVLPSFLEFVRGCVLVGHNVVFDVEFLDAALARCGRGPLDHAVVDTLALARRLLRPDVPDCRLHTLAGALGLAHRPSHRALDDVRATADLLHLLIERATGYGVLVLGDLVAFMTGPVPAPARATRAGA